MLIRNRFTPVTPRVSIPVWEQLATDQKLIRGRLFPNRYLLPMTHLLISIAFILCRVGCLGVTGVRFLSGKNNKLTPVKDTCISKNPLCKYDLRTF